MIFHVFSDGLSMDMATWTSLSRPASVNYGERTGKATQWHGNTAIDVKWE